MKKFKFNSPEVIAKKIRLVAGQSDQYNPSFDGGILATIMKLIYYHGLILVEFNIMKISDVLDRGKIAFRLKSPYQLYLNLHNDYKILVQCHLDYLKENNYNVAQDAPLFPKLKTHKNKNESLAYPDYQIRRHLKDYASIDWKQLRKDGIYHHYQLLKWQGYTNQIIITFAAWYFRTTPKEIYTTLKQGGITLSDVNLAPVIEPPKAEPAPVETKPQVKLRRKRTEQRQRGSYLEQLERKIHEMNNQGQEDHDRDNNDNEDGTDLSRPIFDPYFSRDD